MAENKKTEIENKGKKSFSKKGIIFGVIFLVLVAVVIWLLVRNNQANNSGQVQGVKEEASQTQEAPKTVPENKYFSENAKIMFFYSDTCSWCQKEKEILGQLGYEGYRFKPMNVGKDTSLWEQYQISGTPTFVAPNGERLIGYREKDELKSWMDKHGAKPTK